MVRAGSRAGVTPVSTPLPLASKEEGAPSTAASVCEATVSTPRPSVRSMEWILLGVGILIVLTWRSAEVQGRWPGGSTPEAPPV